MTVPARTAAFFDVDKTLVHRPAMVAFAGPLRTCGLIDRRLVALAAWNHLRFRLRRSSPARHEKFRAEGMRIVTGWSADQVRSVVCDSLAEVLAPWIYPEALELIAEHQRAGQAVYIVSAEPVEIAEPLADHLGIDGAIASVAAVDAEGCYTGETERFVYGEHKAVAMRSFASEHGIDLSGSVAYSDSATDVPMLEAVGYPICVNPDRAMARVAGAQGWPVRRFAAPSPRPARVVPAS